MKKIKDSMITTTIPYSRNQEHSVVEIKRWHGDEEQRIDIIFRTANNYVSHSLSLKQYKQLKDAISKETFPNKDI